MNAAIGLNSSCFFPYFSAIHEGCDRGDNDMRLARRWKASAGVVAYFLTEQGACMRCAHLHLSFGQLSKASALWGARFWEEDAPEGAKPVDWLLTSQQPVGCVEDALRLLRNRPDLVTRLACR